MKGKAEEEGEEKRRAAKRTKVLGQMNGEKAEKSLVEKQRRELD